MPIDWTALFDVPTCPTPIESVAVLPGPVPVPPRLTTGLTVVPAAVALGAAFGEFDWAVRSEPVEVLPPPICAAPIELSEVLPPPLIPFEPPTEPDVSPVVDDAEPVGEFETLPPCAVPAESVALLPPPICAAPIELSAVLPPPPIAF